MKQKNIKNKFTIKSLVTTVSMVMAGMASTAHASDIEIYKLPDKSQTTIMMLIDTSGSMQFCDYTNPNDPTSSETPDGYGIPRDYRYSPGAAVIQLYNANTRQFDRYIPYSNFPLNGQRYSNTDYYINYSHYVSGNTVRFHRAVEGETWGFTGGSTTWANFMRDPNKISIPKTISVMNGRNWKNVSFTAVREFKESALGTRYYQDYCTSPVAGDNRTFPTRASRLVDAIMTLMDSDGLDENIHIGVASFSNTQSSVRGTGIVRQKALPMTKENRKKIQELFADETKLPFTAATPTATTYIVGAAYMLGTNINVPSAPDWSTRNNLISDSRTDKASYSGSNYISPLPKNASDECNGQAIYYMTDGIPSNANVVDTDTGLRQPVAHVLGINANNLPNTSTTHSLYTLGTDNGSAGIAEVAEMAKLLSKGSTNPSGLSIKTAIVGFGADFSPALNKNKSGAQNEITGPYRCDEITSQTIRSMCKWGEKGHGYGEGGFYYVNKSSEIVDSFMEVVNNAKVNFDSIATGSPTVPVSTLNRQRMLDDAYYASFTPKPDKPQQLWTGNMNKYQAIGGGLVGRNGGVLLTTEGYLNSSTLGFWDSEDGNVRGVTGNLPLQQNDRKEFRRTIYTNRRNNTTDSTLNKVNVAAFGSGVLAGDSARNYWLNLLGYDIGVNDEVDFSNLLGAELRQMGSVMHSSPILLTQSGKINRDLEESDRDDYLLYGSTQGLLHVVDANTGVEKFTFVPNEMVENQKDAFLKEESTYGGKDNLFYGIDAPWVNHAEYVVKQDDSLRAGEDILTVGKARDDVDVDPNNPEQSYGLHGKQWVYGGLRMGGKSYYSLDLSDLDNPALKFHIDPAAGVVRSSIGGVISYPELQHMGQSWSKPALGYVRWKGERKHVMFVGGGYDVGYESSNYRQTNGVGAGVYMFDANTGELLWWASSHSTTGNKATKHSVDGDDADSLRYSIVSRINATDRDSDGLVDALYFGDLGGQAFRIDLDNGRNASTFSLRVVKLFDAHEADGTSPRFYEMPSVSIENTTRGNSFAVVGFGSGDRSSPLAGDFEDRGVKRTINTETAEDATFVSFDYDLGRPGWKSLRLRDLMTRHNRGELQPADLDNGVEADEINQGWKFTYPAEKLGGQKSFGEPYTLANFLFVNVYDRDNGGIHGTCGGGVIGQSFAYQFCLPSGRCDIERHGYDNDTLAANSAYASQMQGGVLTSRPTPGLVEMTLGSGGRDGVSNVGNISTGTDALDCTRTPQAVECLNVATPSTLNSVRWFESRKEND